jgi:methionyl-tRNA formyltransferase
MRVAVIAGSIAAGVRIAEEMRSLPGVEVFVIACNAGRRSAALRWTREFAVLGKSCGPRRLASIWRFARSNRLLVLGALDEPGASERLRSLQCDVGLHAANVIYRQQTISAFRLGILNAHIGILPQYRGRSVAEWSVLQGDSTGVTVFFIDSGIDTGARIVLREFIPVNGARSAAKLKNQLFACDARLYRRALEALMSPGFQSQNNEIARGQRYYVMSRLFTEVVDEILSRNL